MPSWTDVDGPAGRRRRMPWRAGEGPSRRRSRHCHGSGRDCGDAPRDRGLARPVRLALETTGLVVATEAIALPLGILLAFFLFRTDVWGRQRAAGARRLGGVRAAALACDGLARRARQCRAECRHSACGRSWSAARGRGRARAGGLALGRLDRGVGLCAVEPELEESALLDYGPGASCCASPCAARSGRSPRRRWRSPC